GDASGLGVGFGFADDLPDLLLVGVLVNERDRRAERDGVAREFRYVDDVGARELVLELRDAALVQRLGFLRGVIFRVLGEVAVTARLGDLLDNTRPFHRLAVAQFGLKLGITRSRHRDLFHRPSLFTRPARDPAESVKTAVALRDQPDAATAERITTP